MAADYRKYMFTIAYIWYDDDNKLFTMGGRTEDSASLNFHELAEMKRKKAAIDPNLQQDYFDVGILFIVALGLLTNLANFVTLLSLFITGKHRHHTSIIFMAMTIANVIHLVCIIFYTMQRQYSTIPLNWMATMSVSFSNWCLLPLLLSAIIEVRAPNLSKWICGPFKTAILMISLAVLSCIPPIPGIAEVHYFTNGVCSEHVYSPNRTETSCSMDYEQINELQTKVVPVVIHGLPLVTSLILVVIAMGRYHPRGIHADPSNEKPMYSESSVQVLLTTVWFIVYYFPTVMLLLVLRSRPDMAADRDEYRSAKGMVKLAMAFRLLNMATGFFVNFLTNSQFRRMLCVCGCRRTRKSMNVTEAVEQMDDYGLGEREPSLDLSISLTF